EGGGRRTSQLSGDAPAATAEAAQAGAAGNGQEAPVLVAVGPGPSPDQDTGEPRRTDGTGEPDGGRSSRMRGIVGEAPAARPDTFGLSRREREVLALIAE